MKIKTDFKIFILFGMFFELSPSCQVKSASNNSIIQTDLVIIGGGPAALSAAVGAGKANIQTTIITGSIMDGAAVKSGEITNFPGQNGLTGSKIVQKFLEHAQEFPSNQLLREEKVVKCDLQGNPFILETNKGRKIECKCLIIATGTNPKKLNVPGEDCFLGKGVAYCSRCDGPMFKNKRVVIVGNDYSALRELASLKHYAKKITLVSDKDNFEAPKMLMDQLKTPGLEVILNAKLEEIRGDGAVNSVKIKKANGEVEVLPTDGVFVATGWEPVSDFVKNQLKLNSKNEIEVDCETNETSVKGVFACGDVCNKSKHQMPTASGDGYDAYLSAEQFLRGTAL